MLGDVISDVIRSGVSSVALELPRITRNFVKVSVLTVSLFKTSNNPIGECNSSCLLSGCIVFGRANFM